MTLSLFITLVLISLGQRFRRLSLWRARLPILFAHFSNEVVHNGEAITQQHRLRFIMFSHVICQHEGVVILLLNFTNKIIHEGNTIVKQLCLCFIVFGHEDP